MASDRPAPTYQLHIDGLRAVAVMAVVGFHAFPDWLAGGFIGVDVFFVISGFLISGIIGRGLAEGRFSYVDFYGRRARRIFPALLIVLVGCFAFGWYVLLPGEYLQLQKHVAAGAGFVANFSLWSEAGYFDTAAETKPLQHLWSLAVEEQFYIFWPLLLALLWKRRHGFLAAALLVATISFAINVMTVRADPVAAFYSPLSRFWELMLGAVLAALPGAWRDRFTRSADLCGFAGIALLTTGLVVIGADRAFPGGWALLPTLGAFLILAAGPRAWLNRRVLARRPFVAVGLISYPLYLWHWPLLVFARTVAGRNLVVVEKLELIAGAVALSYATYRFVERPIRQAAHAGATASGSAPRYTAALLSAAMACVLAVAGISFLAQAAPRNADDALSKFLVAAYDWDYPDGIGHRVFAGSIRRAYAAHGDLPGNTLFVGDSNMEQYYPRIRKLVSEHPDRYNSAVMIGNQRQRCNPVIGIFLRDDDECGSMMRDITDLANRADTQAVVLVYAGLSYDLLTRSETTLARFSGFIRSARAAGKRVYVILNMPDGDELDPRGMFTGSRLGHLMASKTADVRFDYSDFMKRFDVIRSRAKRAALDGGATVIDPLDFLCAGTVCPVFDAAGDPLYKDAKHMRASYARASASYIDATMVPNR